MQQSFNNRQTVKNHTHNPRKNRTLYGAHDMC